MFIGRGPGGGRYPYHIYAGRAWRARSHSYSEDPWTGVPAPGIESHHALLYPFFTPDLPPRRRLRVRALRRRGRGGRAEPAADHSATPAPGLRAGKAGRAARHLGPRRAGQLRVRQPAGGPPDHLRGDPRYRGPRGVRRPLVPEPAVAGECPLHDGWAREAVAAG